MVKCVDYWAPANVRSLVDCVGSIVEEKRSHATNGADVRATSWSTARRLWPNATATAVTDSAACTTAVDSLANVTNHFVHQILLHQTLCLYIIAIVPVTGHTSCAVAASFVHAVTTMLSRAPILLSPAVQQLCVPH
jgi:hypothetical protein